MSFSYIPLIIGDTSPGESAPLTNWLWLDTGEKKVKRWNGISWEVFEFTFENPTLTGNIYHDGKKGINANITLADGKKLKFHKGILWEVENPKEIISDGQVVSSTAEEPG